MTKQAPRNGPRHTGHRRATVEGTRRYVDRHRASFVTDFYRPMRAGGGLQVSSIALGTYLGESDQATDDLYRGAVRAALTRGINMVDTAINYRCQRSERAIGAELRELIASGVVRRDEIVVCTKAGYLPLDGEPPTSREGYEAYLEREYVAPGILDRRHLVGGGHAISPSFLEDQLNRSLKNLGVDSIDCFYIHNPEQQLGAIAPTELSERMRSAFAALERCVAAGKIGAYGVATWSGLRLPAGSQGHLSLYELAGLATEAGGTEHHFRLVQLPINLTMSEAIRVSTQRDGRGHLVHVADAAAELGIDLVVSAPLMQGQLTRDLPAPVRELFEGSTDAQRALAFVRSIPAVVSAAVGMKDPGHLSENLEALRSA